MRSTTLKILSVLLALCMLLAVFAACGKTKSDKDLIEERIKEFESAFNDGDFDALLDCMDKKARNTYKAASNLLNGISVGIGLGGFSASASFNLADLFGFAVGTLSDGDLISIEIIDIEIDDEDALVYVELTDESSSSDAEDLCFEMVKEEKDWFIHDITEYDSAHSSETADGSGSTTTNDTADDESDENAKGDDPFQNISIVVGGVSPYCELAVNNSSCSEDVQRYVTYTFDKDHYANGDTATITAVSQTDWSGNDRVVLSRTTYTYQVSGQPAYLSSVTGVDLTTVKNELKDYMTSKTSSAIGSWNAYLFDVQCYEASSIDWSIQNEYFSVLKPIRQDDMGRNTPYNKYSFIIKCTVKHSDDQRDDLIFYAAVTANNVIRNTDGTIKWGLESTDAFDFTYKSSKEGLENCITTAIMTGSDDYNITKIS